MLYKYLVFYKIQKINPLYNINNILYYTQKLYKKVKFVLYLGGDHLIGWVTELTEILRLKKLKLCKKKSDQTGWTSQKS